ncbi:MAG: protein phosphatase 2C domain-containing protein [Pseudomonadota bacterium]
MQFDFSAAQIIGARKRQEDSCSAERVWRLGGEGALLITCDGMGGHAGGDVASQTVQDTLQSVFAKSKDDPLRALRQGLTAANEAVSARISENADLEGMGTTIVAVFVQKSDLCWISVGDSHLYHMRDGKLQKLNADHSLAPVLDKMAATGEISAEDALNDPQRNALRAAVMGDSLDLVDAERRPDFLKPGDWLILCSDGLDTLSEAELLDVLKSNAQGSTDQIVEKLLAAVEAQEAPKQDNASIVALKVSKANFSWRSLVGLSHRPGKK